MSSDPSIKHLAHDLNNIFSRILNSVDLLKRKTDNTPDVISILNSIESAAYLASEMIDDSTPIETEKSKRRRISLNSIINEIVRTTSFQYKDKIIFQTELANNLKPIGGKYSDYYRIILNLIINSVEAIPQKGSIHITTKNTDADNTVEIKIKDSGVGIDKNYLPRVFDENFSTKNKVGVSGLGLSIVKKLIETYLGRVIVSSEIGNGTEFKIFLPAMHESEIEIEPNDKTVLIAEDESALLELMVDLLQSYGYKTIIASNGIEVLSKLEGQTLPHLLIIDRKMPEMDGLACIKEIMKRQYHIPIILVSGSPSDIETNFITGKKIRYINKPYNFEELLTVIKELTR